VFATLLGALPRPSGDDDRDDGDDDRDDGDGDGAGDRERDVDALVRTAIRAQVAAGLEPMTDGRLRGHAIDRVPEAPAVIAAWRFAAAETDRAVKQALPGPYSIGWRMVKGGSAAVGPAAVTSRAATAMQAAASLREIVGELAAAGCPMVEIEETEAHLIGADEVERELFRRAHEQLTAGITGTHLSLSIVGGSAWDAGLETVLDAPYASLAVDLIAGPDNWNLVTRLAGDRGVVAGALPAKDSPADAKEMLLWAARYAAASKGRGLDRVGLGSAGSWANLTWEAAVRKMQHLGEAARLASMPASENLRRQLDPRAVDARTAAMGHGTPSRRRPR
jgi:methionine synthase II (cobalamin-independent)